MKHLLASCLLSLAAASAHAIHYDVWVTTSEGPVAGSQIEIGFFGDLSFADGLPVDTLTGAAIFPGDFNDLEGGPRMTDDPGFQGPSGTFLAGEEIHFRALGALSVFDDATGSWQEAAPSATLTLYGGIPNDVIVNYLTNPFNSSAAGAYAYWQAGTRFTGTGISGPTEAIVDDAKSGGSFHSHLDWELNAAAPAGIYLVELQLFSTAKSGGTDKYLASDPFMVMFQSEGANATLIETAMATRTVSAVPEPETALMWLTALPLLVLARRRRASR